MSAIHRRWPPCRLRSTGTLGSARGRAGSSPRPCRTRCSPPGLCPTRARRRRVPRRATGAHPSRPRRDARSRQVDRAPSHPGLSPRSVSTAKSISSNKEIDHMSVRFGMQTCADLAAGAQREWLVPDGLGGYAMGTVSGLRTRRYHGLLVVSGQTPSARHVGLVSLDPVLVLPSGGTVRLAVHEWASGAVDPRGHELLEHFDLADGLPRWRWRIGDIVVERELAMVYGQPSLAVVHRLVEAPGRAMLAMEALCTWR